MHLLYQIHEEHYVVTKIGLSNKVGYSTTKHLRCRENPLQERAIEGHGKIGQDSAH
jgi:hypothetical protein